MQLFPLWHQEASDEVTWIIVDFWCLLLSGLPAFRSLWLISNAAPQLVFNLSKLYWLPDTIHVTFCLPSKTKNDQLPPSDKFPIVPRAFQATRRTLFDTIQGWQTSRLFSLEAPTYQLELELQWTHQLELELQWTHPLELELQWTLSVYLTIKWHLYSVY